MIITLGSTVPKKIKRYFQLYPTAMTRDVAKLFFTKYYHAALHVLIWVKYDHLADKAKFVLPHPCLQNRMENLLEEVDNAHN